ncbi:MAG: hypothetical protein ACRCSF_11990 [Mycobacteriaceae bacterium]
MTNSIWCVPESTQDESQYPESSVPPWPAQVRATLWWHRSTEAAASFGPGGKVIPLTLAMVVDYLDSPVGPYREILASPVLRCPGKGLGLMPLMAIPFIAVDSKPSVHGGRMHWYLPKVMADFGGDVLTEATAIGQDWQVTTQAQSRGPHFPIAGVLGFAQPAGDSLVSLASSVLRGKARYARVAVAAQGPTLGRWLQTGTHHGLQIVAGRMSTRPAKMV